MKKDNENKTQDKKPFFARLLERQELETVKGGPADVTTKFPSDTDEFA